MLAIFTATLSLLLSTTLCSAALSPILKTAAYAFPRGQKSYEYAEFVCVDKPGSKAYDLEWSRMLNAVCLVAFLRTHQLAKEDVVTHPEGKSRTRKKRAKAVYSIGQAEPLSKRHMLVISSVIRTFVPSATLLVAEAPINAIAQRWAIGPFDVFDPRAGPVLHVTRTAGDKSFVDETIKIPTDKTKAVLVMSILEKLPCVLKERQPFGVFLVFDESGKDGGGAVTHDLAFNSEELLKSVRFLIRDGRMSIEYTVGLPVAGPDFATLLPEAPPPTISLPAVTNFHYSRDRFGPLRSWNRMLASYYRHILHQMAPEADSSIDTTLDAIRLGMATLFPQSNLALASTPSSFPQGQAMRLKGKHVLLSDDMLGNLLMLSFHSSRPSVDPEALEALNGIRTPNRMPSLLLHPPGAGALRGLLLKSLESAIAFQEELAIEATRALSLFCWGISLGLVAFCKPTPYIDWLTQALPAAEYLLLVDTGARPVKLGVGYIVALERQSGAAVRTLCDIVVIRYENDVLAYVQIADSGNTFEHFHSIGSD